MLTSAPCLKAAVGPMLGMKPGMFPYTVLVRASEPGVWAWHCHILPHAEREDGMFGMVTAMIVK